MTRTPLPKVQAQMRIEDCPASIAQRPWLEPDNIPVHEQWLPVVWRLEGPLDVRAFLAAFQELVSRHEILRTHYIYRKNAWRQTVGPVEAVQLRPVDMMDADSLMREALIWDRLKVIYDVPVSLEGGVVRLELFRIGHDRHLLAGFLHHVATDNISLRIFFRDLMDFYLRRVSNADPEPPPRLQYADFALWEAKWFSAGGGSEAARYWKKALAKAAPFHLPGGGGRRAPMTGSASQAFEIPPQTLGLIQRRARDLRCTVPVMFYAALSLALAKWSARNQVLFGAFTHGRPPGFADVMGCFIQARPFFVDLSDDPRVTAFIDRAREAAIAVSDFRRPVERDIMDELEVGTVLVNYVRSSRRKAAASPPTPLSADSASPQDVHRENDRTNGSLVAIARSDIDHRHGVAEPWARRAESAGAKALARLAGSGGEHLRAGMSRLPLRLQPHFTRDLHLGVLETDGGLHVQATTRKGGVSPADVVTMMSDLVSVLDAFGSSSNPRASSLAG